MARMKACVDYDFVVEGKRLASNWRDAHHIQAMGTRLLILDDMLAEAIKI